MVQNQQKPATRPAEFIVVLWQLEKPRHKLIQLDKAAFMLYQGKDKRYWASGDSTGTFIAKISKIAEKQKFIGGGLKLLVCLWCCVRILGIGDHPARTNPHLSSHWSSYFYISSFSIFLSGICCVSVILHFVFLWTNLIWVSFFWLNHIRHPLFILHLKCYVLNNTGAFDL